jgi:hypothetical protein
MSTTGRFKPLSAQQPLHHKAEYDHPGIDKPHLFKVDQGLTRHGNRAGLRVARVSDRTLPYEFVVLNNPAPMLGYCRAARLQ